MILKVDNKQVFASDAGKDFDKNKETIIQAEKVIIATGSIPVSLPKIEFDEKKRKRIIFIAFITFL